MKLENLMDVMSKEENVMVNLTTIFPLEGDTTCYLVSFPISEAEEMLNAYLGVDSIEIHRLECYHWKGDSDTVQIGVILDPDEAEEEALRPFFEDYGEKL